MGDGADTIFEAAIIGDIDRLELGAGIAVGDVSALRSASDSDDVTLNIGGSTPGSILVDEQFAAATGSGMEEIVFADGTVWTKDDVQRVSLLTARTSGDDVIRGFAGRADTLSGWSGNDQLYGYSGSDTYLIDVNEGNDTIFETDDVLSHDRLIFGAGTVLSNLVVQRASNDQYDMVISFQGYTGSVRIDQQFVDRIDQQIVESTAGIEEVVLGDGSVLDWITLLKQYGGRNATAGNDTFVSTAGWATDAFWGGGGDDVMSSGSSWTHTYYFYDLGDGNELDRGHKRLAGPWGGNYSVQHRHLPRSER